MLEQKLSSSVDLDAIVPLLKNNETITRGKFWDNETLGTDPIVNHLLERLAGSIATKQGRMYLRRGTGGTASGIVVVESSEWDTNHFEISMGRLPLVMFDQKVNTAERRELFSEAFNSEPYEMLSTRVNLLDNLTIQALEREGGALTDVLLTFRFDSSRLLPSLFARVRATEARPEDYDILARKSEKMFAIDRFHSDPNLSGDKSDQLYSKWISNSFRGLADCILVVREKDEPVGFITCKIERVGQSFKYGVIDLIAVDPSEKGRGLGSALVNSALAWFAPRVRSVYVGTQAANIQASRLYERAGFRHACSEATFHIWSI